MNEIIINSFLPLTNDIHETLAAFALSNFFLWSTNLMQFETDPYRGINPLSFEQTNYVFLIWCAMGKM